MSPDRNVTHVAGSYRPKAYVFRGENGQALDRDDLAENLRDHVQNAGVQRPQLFAMDGKRIWLRAHDLRASFVTVSLANGKTESWVADRATCRAR